MLNKRSDFDKPKRRCSNKYQLVRYEYVCCFSWINIYFYSTFRCNFNKMCVSEVFFSFTIFTRCWCSLLFRHMISMHFKFQHLHCLFKRKGGAGRGERTKEKKQHRDPPCFDVRANRSNASNAKKN